MRTFNVIYTGDYLDEDGEVAYGDIGQTLLEAKPWITCSFLLEQKPVKGQAEYWDRVYSLEISPRHIAEANALVIFRPWVKATAFVEGANNLVVIARAGAGYDKIDIKACTAHDVAVFNAPDTLTHSTASSTMLFMLALSKRLPAQESLVRSGRWDQQRDVTGKDLTGLTLGIVGLGRTGAELARLVTPFKMRVLAFSPHAHPEQARELGVSLVSTLDDLLTQSDFVSLHCRLQGHNRRMIGERELRLMKPSSYFINVARGELLDQSALARALSEGWIAGAGLDVYEVEPLPRSDPLLELTNVILTPHWLPATQQAAKATMDSIATGILQASQGLVPQNILDTAVLARPGFRAKLDRFVCNRQSEAGGLVGGI